VVITVWLKNAVLTQRATAASHKSGPSVKGPRGDPGQARGDLSASPSQCKCHPYCSLSHPQARVSRRMKRAQAHQNWPDQKLTKAFFQPAPMPSHIGPISVDDVRRGILPGSPIGDVLDITVYIASKIKRKKIIRLIPYTLAARGNSVQPKIAVSRSTQI
jgi:hypothetical protein